MNGCDELQEICSSDEAFKGFYCYLVGVASKNLPLRFSHWAEDVVGQKINRLIINMKAKCANDHESLNDSIYGYSSVVIRRFARRKGEQQEIHENKIQNLPDDEFVEPYERLMEFEMYKEQMYKGIRERIATRKRARSDFFELFEVYISSGPVAFAKAYGFHHKTISNYIEDFNLMIGSEFVLAKISDEFKELFSEVKEQFLLKYDNSEYLPFAKSVLSGKREQEIAKDTKSTLKKAKSIEFEILKNLMSYLEGEQNNINQ